ncbi:MAG TPA: hypothetical protein DGT23_01600 [Micromonosporaceae bacterium]|nr:hypothetical protein [Micromonosporaceae bacterium]
MSAVGDDGWVSAVDLYKAMLRDQVGPALRVHGFRGSSKLWIKVDAGSGDYAIVQAQSSTASLASEVRFAINLAVVPVPWWQWQQERFGSKTPREYDGLWHARLTPHLSSGKRGGDRWWQLSDAASADACGREVIALLAEVGLPWLGRLLHRPTLIDLARQHDPAISEPIKEVALPVLLSDEGPSPELDDALQQLQTVVDANPRLDRAAFDGLAQWIRDRASSKAVARVGIDEGR